jgi:DNA repair exonuclease SbcCD ATPase subunit
MKIKTLSIQGFKSFDRVQVIDFESRGNGFYYITGDNQVETELGSNGAGKSTVFEALCFVLYGKTSTNLKAGSIGNWKGKKPCVVTLEFEKNGGVRGDWHYTIKRTWSPNSLQFKAKGVQDPSGRDPEFKTITQEDVDDVVGLNFQSFLFSVFVSQFSSKFFDLSSENKLSVFSHTLGLEKWLKFSDRAKKKVDDIVKDEESLELIIYRLEGEIKSLEEQDFTELQEQWDRGQETKIEEKEKDVDELEHIAEENTRELVDLDADFINLKKDKQLYIRTTERLRKKRDSLERQRLSFSNDVAKIRAEEERYIEERDKFGDVKDKCPYCHQKVTKKYLDGEIKRIKNMLIHVREKEKMAEAEATRHNDKWKRAHNDYENERERLNQANNSFNLVKHSLDAAKGVANELVNDLKLARGKLREIKKEKSPYEKVQEQNKKKLRGLRNELLKENKRLKEICEEGALYEYWVKGFKEIRLFVIDEALGELEIQMNNSLQELGLIDWDIRLMVDRETKSRTISKGFTVMVKAPINDELVPFECWSGGEAQRLKLAGTLAMSDFIRNRTGADWDIEVFDEPSAWLSKEGIDAMLEVLRGRVIDERRKIFIIDHRDFNTYGGFDGTINIVKDKRGSRVEG